MLNLKQVEILKNISTVKINSTVNGSKIILSDNFYDDIHILRSELTNHEIIFKILEINPIVKIYLNNILLNFTLTNYSKSKLIVLCD